MAGSLGGAIKEMVGAPSSVRVGMVDSVSPVSISAQGVPFEDVGVLTGAHLLVGNPVVMLGQSSQEGSDPASWLALGTASPTGLRILTAEQSTGSILLPAALTDLTGTELTVVTTLPTTRVQMWTFADLDVAAAVIATAVVRPIVDGVALAASTQIICESPVAAIGGRWTLAGRAVFTLAPGTHEVKLQGQTAVGAANTFRTIAGTTGYMLNVYG